MRYRLQPIGERIGAGENRQHAGKRQRTGEIHAADGGMGMRRADHHRPRRVRQIKIDGILPSPGNEAQILPAMARKFAVGMSLGLHRHAVRVLSMTALARSPLSVAAHQM